MILTLSETKKFLRIDEDWTEEDSILQLLIDASEEYLLEATGITYDSTNRRAKLFCLVLVSDWYDNRALIGKVSDKVRHTITSMLTQLQYSEVPS